MDPIVLGFTGRIGSGKTTISSVVAEKLDWPRVSFGDYVRKIAQERGLEESREVLQQLGESLLSGNPEQFCRAVLAHAHWKQGQSLVIDGVRHIEVVDWLRHLVAPAKFLLVYVAVSESARQSRLLERDRTDASLLPSIESHSTERDVTSVLLSQADLIIDSSQSPEQITKRIMESIM